MIEESELAKSIRLDEEKRVGSSPTLLINAYVDFVVQIETDIVVRGRATVTELTQVVSSAKLLKPPSGSADDSMAADIAANARAVVAELATAIQETDDPVRLEELLEINDQLLGLLKKVPAAGGKASRPILSLRGLGLNIPGDAAPANGFANGSGAKASPSIDDYENEVEDSPTTPRVDKGKRRADPEPEVIEKVLSPALLINETSEDEDEEAGYGTPPEEGEIPGQPSPIDRCVFGFGGWVGPSSAAFSRRGTVSSDRGLLVLGREAGLQRRAKCSGRVRCCWDLKRWRASTLGKISVKRYVSAFPQATRPSSRGLPPSAP
jgi:protein phosphatase 1 regulatory subunit 37